MVSKEVLQQYMDLKNEIIDVKRKIADLEKQIDKLENTVVKDKVKGGEGGLQSFNIEGFPTREYSKKKTLLYARKTTLSLLEADIEEKIVEVEQFIAGISDSRIRRIIDLRYINNYSWNDVAAKIGGGNSEDTVRKQFERFMEKLSEMSV